MLNYILNRVNQLGDTPKNLAKFYGRREVYVQGITLDGTIIWTDGVEVNDKNRITFYSVPGSMVDCGKKGSSFSSVYRSVKRVEFTDETFSRDGIRHYQVVKVYLRRRKS